MAKQLNWLQIEKAIRQNGLTLVSPQDLRHLLRGSEVSLRFLLTRAHKRGDVIKLRRELYALSDRPPTELEVANALLKPSYVSLLYALAYHHLIPEAVYEITSITTRTTRRFEALNHVFTYHHVAPTAFTGYRAETIGGKVILIAEPEKALVDSLYFTNLGKLVLPERLDASILDKERMLMWSRLYHRPDLVKTAETLQ
jgi:predicted transcriptional regulator of viral defense system